MRFSQKPAIRKTHRPYLQIANPRRFSRAGTIRASWPVLCAKQVMTTGDDRRRHSRFDILRARATIYRGPQGPEGLVVDARPVRKNWARTPIDLCEGGAQIVVSDRLEPGTAVYGAIDVDECAERIQIRGEIRWCAPLRGPEGAFRAGVMFKDLDPSQVRAISLVRECLVFVRIKALRAMKQPEEGKKRGSPPASPKKE